MATIQRVQIVNPAEFLPAYQVSTEDGPMVRLPDAAYAVGVTMDNGASYLHEARFDRTPAGLDKADRLWARVMAAGRIDVAYWDRIA